MSERIHMENDVLVYDGRTLGPAHALYVDVGELRNVRRMDGVIRIRTPERIDYIFAANGYVVGVESKLCADLYASHSIRRLARQVRTMLTLVDIPCIMVRGDMYVLSTFDLLYKDLVRYQQLGVRILVGPEKTASVPTWLKKYREVLGTSAVGTGALEFEHALRPPRSGVGYLLQAIEGLGPRTAVRLYKAAGSVRAALDMDDDTWRKLGISQRVVDARKRALA